MLAAWMQLPTLQVLARLSIPTRYTSKRAAWKGTTAPFTRLCQANPGMILAFCRLITSSVTALFQSLARRRFWFALPYLVSPSGGCKQAYESTGIVRSASPPKWRAFSCAVESGHDCDTRHRGNH